MDGRLKQNLAYGSPEYMDEPHRKVGFSFGDNPGDQLRNEVHYGSPEYMDEPHRKVGFSFQAGF